MTENTSGADTSYEQALKSTGIVGGAQFLTILITVVKTKIVALLLGPAGVGVLGLLQGIVDMIRNATGLGIHFSAVKDVAAANASRDGQRIGRTIRILRRWVWGTGLLGMTVAIALSIPLSRFSFGNAEYAVPIVLVSVVLLLTSLQEGQLALLQGLRMIGKMAKAKVAGARSRIRPHRADVLVAGREGNCPRHDPDGGGDACHFMVVCPRHPGRTCQAYAEGNVSGRSVDRQAGFFHRCYHFRVDGHHVYRFARSSRKKSERTASECFRRHGTFQMYIRD